MSRYFLLFTLFLIVSLHSAKIGSDKFSGFQTGHMSFSCNYIPSGISKLNNYIEDFGLDGFDDFTLSWGVELTGNVNPNIGTGVQYYTGWDKTQKIVAVDTSLVNVGSIDLDRCVDYNMTYYGIILNYRKNFNGSIEYYGSFSGNHGNIKLMFTQDEGDQSFDATIGSFNPTSEIFEYNRSSHIDIGFWMFTISSGMKYYFSDRIAIGGSVGYVYGLVNDSGTLNYEFESLNNLPDLDFDGLTYTISLYYGS